MIPLISLYAGFFICNNFIFTYSPINLSYNYNDMTKLNIFAQRFEDIKNNKKELDINLFGQSIERIKKNDEQWEYWLSWELMIELWYKDIKKFNRIIIKAINSCKEWGIPYDINFIQKEDQYILSRFACYLIAINWDESISEIFLAKIYFATETRKSELSQQRKSFFERYENREELRWLERFFQSELWNLWINGDWIGSIRSKWDTILLWMPTSQYKKLHNISEKKAIADYLPTVLLSAKSFATQMTNQKIKEKKVTKYNVENIHTKHNQDIRSILEKNDISPENLPIEEDINKLIRKANKIWIPLPIKNSQEFKDSNEDSIENEDKIFTTFVLPNSINEIKVLVKIIKDNPWTFEIFVWSNIYSISEAWLSLINEKFLKYSK